MNGKCEREWFTMESRLQKVHGNGVDYGKLDDVVFAYNHLHKHAALALYTMTTPY